MNGLSTPWAKRLLAASILIVLVGSALSLVVQTFIAIPQARNAEIAGLAEALAEARSSAGRQTQLQQRQTTLSAELTSLSAFWAGPSRTQVAAAMQDVLRSATQQAGGQIVSSSVRDGDAAGDTLGVRARINGTLATLQHVLTTIETAKPLLFVDSLVVTASGASTKAQPQSLSFELAVVGYLPPGKHAPL